MNNTLHIRAVGDLRCPFVGADGVPVPGRYAGRARKTHEPMPDGEHVPDVADHRRAVERGDLAIVPPKPIAPAKTATKEPAQ